MVEDLELNLLIKESFEERGAFAVRPRRRRSVWQWTAPALLAASVTLVAVLQATFAVPETRVTDVISLLCTVDGVELSEGESAADMLLAWQELPCEES